MDKLRVVLAMHSDLLFELLAEGLQETSDIEIVGTARDPIETLLAVRETDADVVVLIRQEVMPPICTYLFCEFPSLIVVTISPNGDSVQLLRQHVCETPLEAINSQNLATSVRAALSEPPVVGDSKQPVHRALTVVENG